MRGWSAAILIVMTAALLPLPAPASSTGPFLGANGIPGGTTCDTGGCHGGPPQDAAQGSVRILGLPAQWTPDTNYNLQVVVQRPSARRFGFQLSAIFSNGRQAGLLSSTDPRISIVTGFSLTTPFAGQYAEHNDAPFGSAQWTFAVTWRSPSSASSGDVTFYVGGNAANGDGSNSGDAIYLTNVRVPAVDVTTLGSHAYSIKSPGGVSWKSDGAGTSTSVGYARIVPDAGSAAPAGLSVFGLRANDVLVGETTVPASPLMRSGRIYAEMSVVAGVGTGIALANPNSQQASVDFFFTDSAGNDFAPGSMTVPANGQIAKFLNESPFSGGADVHGTFTFSSNVPVAITALRGFTNERGEYLLNTLPVTDLSVVTPTDTQVLAHYAAGGGWTTDIILVNPTDSALTGGIEFYSPGNAGSPGSQLSRVAYGIARRSSQRISAPGGTGAVTGSVRVVPDSGNAAPVSAVIFAFKPSSSTLAIATVPAVRGTAFRMYAESSGTPGSTGAIQTAIAIANTSGTPAVATVELYRFDGTPAGGPVSLTIPAFGQLAKFMGEIFPGSSQPFQGVLRIASSTPLSVIGLRGRYNERADFIFTTIPVSQEQAAPAAEFLFPQLANGGGYSTQFILFNGGPDQTVSGVLRLFQPDGVAFNLTLN